MTSLQRVLHSVHCLHSQKRMAAVLDHVGSVQQQAHYLCMARSPEYSLSAITCSDILFRCLLLEATVGILV